MDYSFLDFLTLLGALGMFLYGMKLMSEGLQKVAGDKMRKILSAMTTNRFSGLFTGFLITAIIQSSTATTVMVVSFVNAGLLTLAQSVSVIMGANIGTTLTAWLISFFGFKFSIASIAIPLFAVALPLMFSSKSKSKSWGEFVIGFALLFMGLEFLKTNVPDLQSNPQILSFLQPFTEMGFGSVLLFVLIGTILTIILQSSSAVMAITLVMCSQGWLSFEIACAMIMGENLGTTVTANIAAIGTNVSAKRAAFSHFLYNALGVLWVILLFYPFSAMIAGLIQKITSVDPHALNSFLYDLKLSDPETYKAITSGATNLTDYQKGIQAQMLSLQTSVSYSLSLFHTGYNLINAFIMIGFVPLYVKICTKVIKGKESDEEFQLKFITSNMLSTSELGVLEAKNELTVFAERTHRMVGMVRELKMIKGDNDFLKLYSRIEKYEDISDRMEVEIANYLNRVSEGKLSSSSKEEIRDILRANTEIESVADSCCNMARTIKRKKDANAHFTEEMHANVNRMLDLCDKAIDRMIEVLKIKEPKDIDAALSTNLENEINLFRTQLKKKNIEDINAGVYAYSDGVYYMDFISECEKLGDYVMNVVEAICIRK
ncbi:Na/Pi cotransporter family protein [Bacteroidales bacterium OttesenSCG-928-J19]|nr:Na/Pi cotransporter family protein [Bacteroidales bacterium OttesenSCG-928-J19]